MSDFQVEVYYIYTQTQLTDLSFNQLQSQKDLYKVSIQKQSKSQTASKVQHMTFGKGKITPLLKGSP